ncbi:MAG: histidine phosphatase family protein [Kangiellaceae bacterium]|nr:histidine phosphatase family protein [Kangiellaceae bacterium]
MKQLLLIRHAKSSWKHPELDDHDRPLNKRGKRDKVDMGQRLNSKKHSIEIAFVSSAERALKTFKGINKQLTEQMSFIVDPELYTFSADRLIQYIYNLDNQYQFIALVGHNPAITEAVNRLTNKYIENVPTCGMIKINFDTDDWDSVSKQNSTIDWFDYPKNSEHL